MSLGKRPELAAPPEIYYNEEEAEKYTKNSRMIEIQDEMSERAIELLELNEDQNQNKDNDGDESDDEDIVVEPRLILDIGCGSGLSGSVLDEHGHIWIGMDISSAMLNVARDREVAGDLLLCDMGQGIPFRPGTFDAAISISAIQWLCNADKRSHSPVKRLYTFFTTLYAALNTGGRAVLQFYPSDKNQTDLITSQAKRAGFVGGLVIDYPNSTKARKYFLVLRAGAPPGSVILPKALTNTNDQDSSSTITYTEGKNKNRRNNRKGVKNIKEWIADKKARRRRQDKDTRSDSKYSGRKRSCKF